MGIIPLFLSLLAIPALGGSGYQLSLKNVYLSHGKLDPAFSPDVTSYTVSLDHAIDQIALTPEIYQHRAEYQGGEENLPLITIHWDGHENDKPKSAAVAVRQQIDLPDDGSSLSVELRVADPFDDSHSMSYVLSIDQSSEPVVVLKDISARDDRGNGVLIEPVITEDESVYHAYVQPDASTIMLTVSCASPDWLTIDGRVATNGMPVPITMNNGQHTQLLQISCGAGSFLSTQKSRQYLLAVMSDYPLEDIPKPRIVVDSVGRDCIFDDMNQWYDCPDPKTNDGRTRVVGFVEPTIRYTVESPDKEVEVRMLNRIPSISFTYRSDLSVIAVAGRYNQTWPLRFNNIAGAGWMRALGWILSALLALLLVSLLTVLSATNIFGIGSPFGATEIASTLTLICQYFSFANFLRGHSLLTQMTDSLKWTTFFWPLPWNIEASRGAAAIALFYDKDPSSVPGDVTDISNAYGALFWTFSLLVLTCLFHVAVMIKFVWFENSHTYPHRLLFGHWESRILHWLAFPATTASAMVLASKEAAPGWKFFAALILALYVAWVIGAYVLVQQKIANKKVTWVWNSSIREDGELEDESGYWSDVYCDQLNTQPVNRSLFKQFFPWKWISTVADIDPVNISPQMFSRGHDDDESMPSAHTLDPTQALAGDTYYPMGKNPKQVEVYRSRLPGLLCPGQRLIAGLFRTQWLDVLFTYNSLAGFHNQVVRDTGEDFVVPLTVKTCQLQGSLTAGRYCFFFDGARVPFVKIADSIYRIVLGVCVGVALAVPNKGDAACFGIISFFSAASLVYAALTCPYARRIENWLLCLVLGSICLSSLGFLGYAIRNMEPSVFADIFLWLTAICCVILAAYSVVVTFSLYSAVICPPLEESRFLEKLANCNVTISDHSEGWAVDMPAYNKNGARDVKAQCTVVDGRKLHVSMYPSGEEATVEIDVEDMKDACTTGTLKQPVLCMFAPTGNSVLGYRHANFYDRSTLNRNIAEFLADDRATRNTASDVARHVNNQVELRGSERTVMCITVIPPKGETLSGGTNSGYDWESSAGSRSRRSGRSQRTQ